ncbi:MAG TPA: response regulator transcription factor, partial [Longimicrobiaceae bacterium]|nr:response regulator transcription factor [Longimicrobiaceae bacterium]
RDGTAGLAAARRLRPVAGVLDIALPGLTGTEICRRLREAGDWTPVIFLTARDDEVDRVVGLELGADDYVTKPFSLLELLARVEALLRRSGGRAAAPAAGLLRFGEVEVDPGARVVRRAGAPVQLPPRAFDLLLALHARDGRVASRHELLTEVWGYRAAVPTRTVDIHVAELRRKLERDPAAPEHILTVWKRGYRLQR